jgi:MoxR-like ATPase
MNNSAPAPAPDAKPSDADLQAVAHLKESCAQIRAELAKVIVGQDQVVEEVLIAILTRSHALLVGVPGLAKTLLVSTLAQTLHLTFKRIQFTPDLMPSDITGTEVIYQDVAKGTREFRFLKGPIFAHMILADEINRTPPKTQAAMLESMQERKVSVGGTDYPLPDPFFVLATQNPIEQEGTYPLPEAQLDRFMYMVRVGYPTEQEELEIMKLTTSGFDLKLTTILGADEILRLQELVRRVPVADHVIKYAMALARATRVSEGGVPDFVKEWVHWGAGPRASQYLIIGAKAHAVLQGRSYVTVQDVRAIAHPVLRHRIVTNFTAEAEGVTTDRIVDKLLEVIPAKEAELEKNPALPKVTGA